MWVKLLIIVINDFAIIIDGRDNMDFNYYGSVCSDLHTVKDFLDELILKLTGIINNKEIIFDIKLILNELVINGAMHGNNCINTKCVSLSLEVVDNRIRIEVKDEGTGIDFNINEYNPGDLLYGGRGLVLVNGLSDELYIDKNKVVAIKNIN